MKPEVSNLTNSNLAKPGNERPGGLLISQRQGLNAWLPYSLLQSNASEKQIPGQVLASQGNPTSGVNQMLDWQKYMEIADMFQHKARHQDREDLRQDIIVRLAEVASNNGHQTFTEASMLRVASYVTMHYWHDQKRILSFLSLNQEIEDDEGGSIELWETLADDKAIDLELWQDARRWLLGCPRRLVRIAHKRALGKPLNHKEQVYLCRYREKELLKARKALL